MSNLTKISLDKALLISCPIKEARCILKVITPTFSAADSLSLEEGEKSEEPCKS